MSDSTPTTTSEHSNEIVERVAIAIFASWYEGSFCEPVSFYTDCDAVLQEDYRRIARAAIAALREPTWAMCRANWTSPIGGGIDDGWRAMIDAALIGGPMP